MFEAKLAEALDERKMKARGGGPCLWSHREFGPLTRQSPSSDSGVQCSALQLLIPPLSERRAKLLEN